MYKIALLTCYFGEFPWYFKFFVHSCRYNLDVDFIIITDIAVNKADYPENIIFIKKNLSEINTLAKKKLGFTVQIEHAYKLCDFKPTYGVLFDDILKPYDFWGHGDIDIVYGNIRKFITNKILSSYDLISVRPEYVSGYFALFRNNKKMNTLFTKSKDHQSILSDSRHYCFDECSFLHNPLEDGMSIYELPDTPESMTHVVKKLHDKKYIKAYFDFHVIEGTPGNLKWEKGVITYDNKFEAMLYHMVRFKKYAKAEDSINFVPPDKFYIGARKFYTRDKKLKALEH